MKQLRKVINTVFSHLPTRLPVGLTEFNTWADSIIELSGKYANEDDMKFALASMVIHADAKHGALPKNYFVVRLRKAACNQVASQVFQDIKKRQADELAKKQLEDTTKETSTESVKQQEA